MYDDMIDEIPSQAVVGTPAGPEAGTRPITERPLASD